MAISLGIYPTFSDKPISRCSPVTQSRAASSSDSSEVSISDKRRRAATAATSWEGVGFRKGEKNPGKAIENGPFIVVFHSYVGLPGNK